jgi:hypothetical protein
MVGTNAVGKRGDFVHSMVFPEETISSPQLHIEGWLFVNYVH